MLINVKGGNLFLKELALAYNNFLGDNKIKMDKIIKIWEY